MDNKRLNEIKKECEVYDTEEYENIIDLIKEIERLKQSMSVIYNISAKDKGLDMKETTQIYCIARDNK